MKKIIVVAIMIMAMVSYNKLFAQKPTVVESNEPGWHQIGQLTASFKNSNESLSVWGADEFTALNIKVSEAPVHIERLQVFYESGDMEEIDVREHFANGTESKVIQLKHPDRDIKKVAFSYHTDPNAKGEKADVILYGLKTNQPAGADAYKDGEVKEETRPNNDQLKDETRDDQSLGDKIEEGTKDAAAAITDQKLKTKVGPGGETAYVDENNKYYYISNAGNKVFITKAQLRDKPKD
jgi:hypothetical protein